MDEKGTPLRTVAYPRAERWLEVPAQILALADAYRGFSWLLIVSTTGFVASMLTTARRDYLNDEDFLIAFFFVVILFFSGLKPCSRLMKGHGQSSSLSPLVAIFSAFGTLFFVGILIYAICLLAAVVRLFNLGLPRARFWMVRRRDVLEFANRKNAELSSPGHGK